MRAQSYRARLSLVFLAAFAGSAWAQVELSPLHCSRESSMRAVADDAPATVRFVNATTGPLRLYRLDASGKRVFDSAIPASESVLRRTFVTHPWLVAGAADDCRAIFLPVAGESTARIATLSIVLPDTGIIFNAVAGGPTPPPQTFPVANGGTGVMNWSLSIPMMTGEMVRGWVRLIPDSGSSDAARPAPEVQVKVDQTGLPPGEYCNLVEVTALGAINSPQNFCVVLLVHPSDTILVPQVEPRTLVFSGSPQAANPPAQTLRIYNLASRPLPLRASASFAGSAKWFDMQPSEVVVNPGQPVSISIQPNLRGLNPGAYRGEVALQFGADAPATRVPVQAVVLPSATAPAGALAAREASAGPACTPTKLLPAFTVLGPDFNVQAGWPIPIEVFVVDDCAGPMDSGSVVTTFSNNDPPLHLSSVFPGRWSGTWPARNVRPSGMTISVRAQQPDKKIEGTAQISGRLQEASDVPVVAAGGVVSAVSFNAGAQGPGSYVAIFGQRLSEGLGVASSLPLQNLMRGTEVFMSGRTVPLLFTSENQVNAMIPFDLKVNGRHQLIVRRGHCMSVPEPLDLVSARPAVFTVDGSGTGQGHIYKAAAGGGMSLARPGEAAAAGDALLLYASGLGQVDPQVESGAAAPGTVLSKTVSPVSVTIGGRTAAVQFAGLAPGFAGLYQVNTAVPDGVAAGDQVPLVITAAGQSSAPVTLAVK